MITPTTDLRLAVAQLIGDLGILIGQLDTVDEIVRNPTIGNQAQDDDAILSELADAHFTADVVVGRAAAISQVIATRIEKGAA